MKITGIDTFAVQLPCPADELRAGKYADLALTRVQTDEGLTGWGFHDVPRRVLEGLVRPLLLGNDPFRVEDYVRRGLGRAAPVEWALWDLIGKAANQPVHRLLGQCRDRIPVYLTLVWPSHQAPTPAQQVEDIVRYAALGFKAVKLQIWRGNPFEDLEVLEGVREQLGGPEKMEVMYDRTATRSGTRWSFETALEVAHRLEALDASWLEEPLQRGDLDGHARLAEATETPIAGGESEFGLRPFARFCARRALDILQPDVLNCGGIATMRKIGGLGEAFGLPVLPHGNHGLRLAPSLQVAATLPGCRVHEVVYVTPPLTLEEQWAPLLAVLNTAELYHLEGDILTIPLAPGLGIDVNEDAVLEYQVPPGTARRPGPYRFPPPTPGIVPLASPPLGA